jgi:ATPase family associated with various cellular activities (AAA).
MKTAFLIIGKQGSGKTTILDKIANIARYDKVIELSANQFLNGVLRDKTELYLIDEANLEDALEIDKIVKDEEMSVVVTIQYSDDALSTQFSSLKKILILG